MIRTSLFAFICCLTLGTGSLNAAEMDRESGLLDVGHHMQYGDHSKHYYPRRYYQKRYYPRHYYPRHYYPRHYYPKRYRHSKRRHYDRPHRYGHDGHSPRHHRDRGPRQYGDGDHPPGRHRDHGPRR